MLIRLDFDYMLPVEVISICCCLLLFVMYFAANSKLFKSKIERSEHEYVDEVQKKLN